MRQKIKSPTSSSLFNFLIISAYKPTSIHTYICSYLQTIEKCGAKKQLSNTWIKHFLLPELLKTMCSQTVLKVGLAWTLLEPHVQSVPQPHSTNRNTKTFQCSPYSQLFKIQHSAQHRTRAPSPAFYVFGLFISAFLRTTSDSKGCRIVLCLPTPLLLGLFPRLGLFPHPGFHLYPPLALSSVPSPLTHSWFPLREWFFVGLWTVLFPSLWAILLNFWTFFGFVVPPQKCFGCSHLLLLKPFYYYLLCLRLGQLNVPSKVLCYSQHHIIFALFEKWTRSFFSLSLCSVTNYFNVHL